MASVRFVGGRTPHKGWTASHGATRKIDTSTWNFKNAPVYFSSLRGRKDLWLTRGSSALFDQGSWGPAGQTGFQIYVGYEQLGYVTDRDSAESDENQWHVEWIGVEGLQGEPWVIDTSAIGWVGEKESHKPEAKPQRDAKHERVSVPEGNIEIESGVNSTLVADVNWEKDLIQWKRDRSRSTQRWQLNRTADGFYTITHSDGNVLTAQAGGGLAIEPLESGKSAQQWDVTPVNVYRLLNRNDSQSRLLSASYENNRVLLYQDENNTNQQWLLISSSPTGTSVSVPTGNIDVLNVGVYRERVLDVDGNGKVIHSAKDEASPTQQWKMVPIAGAEGFYHISHSDGNALAFGEWDLTAESPDTAKINQQWRVTPTAFYRVVNQQTGLDLSVNSEQPYDGERIVQYKYDRRPNQHWKLRTIG